MPMTILTNKDRKVTLKLFLIFTHNCQNIVPDQLKYHPSIRSLHNFKCFDTQIYILLLYKIMLYEGQNKMPLG